MKPTPHDPKQPRPDLEALLRRLPPDEAERLREVWMLAGDAEPVPSPSSAEVEQALGRLLVVAEASGAAARNGSPAGATDGLRRPDRAPRERTAVRRTTRTAWLAAAAVLVIGVLSLFWWTRPVTQHAAPGQQRVVMLPDGSRVELNSGSHVQYARRFGDVRGVRLHGEAFFDVTEAARPFVVETFNAEIRVLGTRFGVRAWPDGLEAGTTVALEAGRVALAPAGQPARAVTMAPGATHRVAAGTASPAPRPLPGVSVDDATAWRRGDLIFIDQPLGVVLADVARRYAIDLQVHPAPLRQKRVTLALRRPTRTDAVVRDLALAFGLAYRETSTGYELFDDAAAAPIRLDR